MAKLVSAFHAFFAELQNVRAGTRPGMIDFGVCSKRKLAGCDELVGRRRRRKALKGVTETMQCASGERRVPLAVASVS